ncbi:MAG TPA: lytic murein transglycosylase [Trebonia sp.]
MAWEGAGTDGYDTGAHPSGSARVRRAAWAGVGFVAAVFAIIVAAYAVWISRIQADVAQVPLVTNVAPQAIASGTGGGTGAAGAVGGGSAGKSAAASPSPLDRVDHAWAARAAAATGIPDRAFLAYASADLTIEAEQPACGLGWNTLAAIGTVESANGTYGGTTLLASGYTSKPIIGVPLDGGKFGGGTVAAIPDTDHGRLDGDPRWDHAVGPFQFLPSTWVRWGADGNGDGIASPNQIDDVALAAARYLCAPGTMTNAAGWRAAVFSYNHSNAYVNEVAGIANRYAADVRGLS